MRDRGNDQPLELGNEAMHGLRRQVEPEKFDGNEPVPIRIEGTEYGSQCAGANLMKNPEWTESFWRRRTRSVRVQ
jgi:hypothetical protein